MVFDLSVLRRGAPLATATPSQHSPRLENAVEAHGAEWVVLRNRTGADRRGRTRTSRGTVGGRNHCFLVLGLGVSREHTN